MGNLILLTLLTVGFLGGNVLKFSLFTPEVKVSFLDCAVFILTAISLIKFKEYTREFRNRLWVIIPLLAFGLVALVSLLVSLNNFSGQEVGIGGLYLGRWIVYSLFFVSLVRLFKVPELKKLMLWLSVGTVLISLGQYLLLPDTRFLRVLEWDDHYYRIIGSWLDPGFTGLLLVFILLYLTIQPLKRKAWQNISWILTYIAMALTYSRSSYLALVAGMAWIAWKQKGWKIFLKMVVLLVATIVLLPRASDGEGVKLERTSSIQARIENWGQTVTIWKDHPILGVGFNTYRYAQRDYGYLTSDKWQVSHAGAGSDSSLLFVAATVGIVGLAAYIWYLKRLFPLGTSSLTLQTTLVALLVHSWFLNSLFYPAILIWLALLIAQSNIISPRHDG